MVEKNFTKIPNALLDNMEELGIKNNRHLLVLIYLLRHKKGYRLSNKQIENALGMHHKTVKDAINTLYKIDLINYKATSQGKVYSFNNLIKKINNVKSAEDNGDTADAKSAEGDKSAEDNGDTADAKSAEGDKSAEDNFSDAKNDDGCTAEGGDKSAEGVRPYRRAGSAVPPTNKTNYKINYKTNYNTSTVSFLKIRSLVEEKISNFFNNILDDICKDTIEEIDSSFYKFKDYSPTDNEINEFIKENNWKVLDKFDIFLYNGIVSESFIYDGKLIKPRLALLNKNYVRLNELLNIYYNEREEDMEEDKSEIEKKKDALFKNAPTFAEFLQQHKDEIEEEDKQKDKYSDLPEEESNWLRAIHAYDPPKEEDLADVQANPDFKPKEEGIELSEEELDKFAKELEEEFPSKKDDDEDELTDEEKDEILAEFE